MPIWEIGDCRGIPLPLPLLEALTSMGSAKTVRKILSAWGLGVKLLKAKELVQFFCGDSLHCLRLDEDGLF